MIMQLTELSDSGHIACSRIRLALVPVDGMLIIKVRQRNGRGDGASVICGAAVVALGKPIALSRSLALGSSRWLVVVSAIPECIGIAVANQRR
jgi:hypothetical protein